MKAYEWSIPVISGSLLDDCVGTENPNNYCYSDCSVLDAEVINHTNKISQMVLGNSKWNIIYRQSGKQGKNY